MNTTYFLNLIAGNVYNTRTSPPLPKRYYIGVSSTTPNVSGTGVTEPTDPAYIRRELTALSAPTNGLVKNTTELRFEESTVAWPLSTHFVIYDSQKGGNLLMYDQLTNSRKIDALNVLILPAGEVQLSFIN